MTNWWEEFQTNLNPESIDLSKLKDKAPCSVCIMQNYCDDICTKYYEWRKNERKNKLSKK